jgi:AcrR family transcriptional regulator
MWRTDVPQSTQQQEDRPRLSRDRVIAAGVALADESGIAALSMRKLGERLGVEAMSLYKHVGNKDDLLDGMVDGVFAELELPSDQPDWRARCGTARCRCARRSSATRGRCR